MRLIPRSRLGRGVLAAVAAVVLWQAGHFGLRYWQFETLFRSDRIVENFRSMPRYFNSIAMHNGGEVMPWQSAEKPLPSQLSSSRARNTCCKTGSPAPARRA